MAATLTVLMISSVTCSVDSATANPTSSAELARSAGQATTDSQIAKVLYQLI